RRRHTRFSRDWSSDVCSSDLRVPSGNVEAQPLVDLVAADPPEVVALRVEEDPLQREARGLEVRRLAGAQERVDRLERLLLGLRRILPQRVLEQRALATPHLDAARKDLDLLDPRPAQAVVDLRRQLLRGLDQDLT